MFSCPAYSRYGIYLKCDLCGATIGGEEVTRREQGIPTLSRYDGKQLRQLAALRGWEHVSGPDSAIGEGVDHCPSCSKKTTQPTQA